MFNYSDKTQKALVINISPDNPLNLATLHPCNSIIFIEKISDFHSHADINSGPEILILPIYI